jgi:hypothetical protein
MDWVAKLAEITQLTSHDLVAGILSAAMVLLGTPAALSTDLSQHWRFALSSDLPRNFRCDGEASAFSPA